MNTVLIKMDLDNERVWEIGDKENISQYERAVYFKVCQILDETSETTMFVKMLKKVLEGY